MLASAPRQLLGYPDPRGLPQLRAVLAGYLARARGVAADPGRIVICAGFAHGLAVSCAALRAAGAATLAVEAYGHQAHRDLAQAQGLRPASAARGRQRRRDRRRGPGGRGAADPGAPVPAGRDPPSAAPPGSGAGWGGVVIEDDYDGEFRYDRQPVGALQALAPDHVVYAGTASKSLAPDAAARLAGRPAAAAGRGERPSSPRAPSAWTSSPWPSSSTPAATTGRSAGPGSPTAAAATGWPPRCTARARHVTGIAAGLHAVLEVPRVDTERQLIARAAGHGLALQGLESFRAARHEPDRAGLVIGYGRPPEHAYTTALARLCAVLDS